MMTDENSRKTGNDSDRNNGKKTGRDPETGRFGHGNPGRPKGARHKTTLAAEALLDGQAEAITQRAIDAALSGEPTAVRLCMERILPARRVRPIKFELPPLKTAADGPIAIAAIADAAAAGDLTTDEADGFARLVESFLKAFEVSDMEARLRRLELAAEK